MLTQGLLRESSFAIWATLRQTARVEFVDEGRLLQNAQGPVAGDPQKIHDCGYFVLSRRGVRHGAKLQLVRTPIALETVEQNVGLFSLHSFQGFLDASLSD